MAAIAERAGVSRQTLYNEFGSREVFAQAFALRAADRFLGDVESVFAASAGDPHAALMSGFERFLVLAEADPMVRMIVLREPGSEELLALFTSGGGPVVEMARLRLSAKMLELWPEVDPGAANLLAEGLVRLGISHASLPVASPREAAEQLRELFAPFIALHVPS